MNAPLSTGASISRRSLLKVAAAAPALGVTGCAALAETRQGGGSFAGFAQMQLAYFFFEVEQAAVERATRALGYHLQSTNAQLDAYVQFQQIQSMLVKQPAFIVTDLADSKAMGRVLLRAERAGVPVAAIDTPVLEGRVALQVFVDNFRCGQMAAERTVELLTRKYGRPKGTVLNVYGSLVSFGWRMRKEGWDDVMRRYPDIRALSRPCEGQEDVARSVTQQTLSQFPELDAAHGPSDALTRGVLNALRGTGKAYPIGDPRHVILTSIDGEPQSIGWLRDRLLDAEISQDPVAYGEVAVELLQRYSIHGRPIPLGTYSNPDKYYWGQAEIVDHPNGPWLSTPPFFVDSSNMDDPRMWANKVQAEWGMVQR